LSNDDGNSIFDELDSRLDDFFADDELSFDESSDIHSDEMIIDSSDEPKVKKSFPDTQSAKFHKNPQGPLDTLKVIVLEMDWELTDENLNKYLEEIGRLKNQYKDDRAIYLFFKLHSSIGTYMLHKKVRAHPDALKFLYQVFNSLEKVTTKNLSTFEKNKMILKEVTNFKNLKARMFPNSYSSVEVQSFVPEQPTAAVKPDFSSLPDDIQKEINDYIEREIAQKIEALKKNFK